MRVRAHVDALTPAVLVTLSAPLDQPNLQRRGGAQISAEVALVSWVEWMNVGGVAVSMRVVLEWCGLAWMASGAFVELF